jgi:hypothetical protein
MTTFGIIIGDALARDGRVEILRILKRRATEPCASLPTKPNTAP